MAEAPYRRPCRFCRRWFAANARQKDAQYACADPACQARRKAANQAAWLEAHPGYFRDRGEKHRRWRRAHPDAQRNRRERDPALRERERVERARRRKEAASRRAVEQDAKALQLVDSAGVGTRVPSAVEQDSIRAQLRVLVGLACRVPPAVEQAPIAGALCAWHDLGRRLLGGRDGTTRTG